MKQTIVLFFLFLFAISCQEEIEPNFSFTQVSDLEFKPFEHTL